MGIKKLAPWNWFKDEEASEPKHVPISRTGGTYASPLTELHQEIDRMFDHTLRRFGLPTFGFENGIGQLTRHVMLKPNVDIAATEKEYSVTVEVPGVEEDHVTLELTGNNLIIKGEKKQESEKKDKDFYRVERSYGSFQRVLTLPDDADYDGIDAEFRNGVLTITMPRKAAVKLKGKVINIHKAA